MKYFVLSILSGLVVAMGMHLLFNGEVALAQTLGIFLEYNEYLGEIVNEYGLQE